MTWLPALKDIFKGPGEKGNKFDNVKQVVFVSKIEKSSGGEFKCIDKVKPDVRTCNGRYRDPSSHGVVANQFPLRIGKRLIYQAICLDEYVYSRHNASPLGSLSPSRCWIGLSGQELLGFSIRTRF